jgi:hypothetical protein
VVDAYDARPFDLEFGLFGNRFDECLKYRGWRNDLTWRLVGKERERHAENVDILGLVEIDLLAADRVPHSCCLIARAPQASSHNLLADELARKRAKAHDVVTVFASKPSESIPTEMTF